MVLFFKKELLLFVLLCFCFALRVRHGMFFAAFGDESEHFVGAKALDAGDILYRTYVDAHGPVIFVLTQAYGALFGWREPLLARSVSAALTVGAGISIAGSPILAGVGRLTGCGFFLGLVASVWLVQGLYLVDYHTVAGVLVIVALSGFVVPCWCGVAAGRVRAMLGGGAIALLVFTAYAFAPAAVLLAGSALWAMRRQGLPGGRHFLLGLGTGGAAVVLWMAVFADPAGYLVFHVIANQLDYGRYIDFGMLTFAASLLPSLAPVRIVHFMALAAGATGFVLLGRGGAVILPMLMGMAGLLLLDARGSFLFPDGALVMASCAMLALAVARAERRFRLAPSVVPLLCVVLMEFGARHALATPTGLARADVVALPPTSLGVSDAPMFRAIRAASRSGERILVLPYLPSAYLWADRLPMQKFYEFLPWDADYASAPWFGRRHDLCAALAASPPPVIVFEDRPVWGRYDPRQYMACVTSMLDRGYRRQADLPDLFVRLDRISRAAPAR